MSKPKIKKDFFSSFDIFGGTSLSFSDFDIWGFDIFSLSLSTDKIGFSRILTCSHHLPHTLYISEKKYSNSLYQCGNTLHLGPFPKVDRVLTALTKSDALVVPPLHLGAHQTLDHQQRKDHTRTECLLVGRHSNRPVVGLK